MKRPARSSVGPGFARLLVGLGIALITVPVLAQAELRPNVPLSPEFLIRPLDEPPSWYVSRSHEQTDRLRRATANELRSRDGRLILRSQHAKGMLTLTYMLAGQGRRTVIARNRHGFPSMAVSPDMAYLAFYTGYPTSEDMARGDLHVFDFKKRRSSDVLKEASIVYPAWASDSRRFVFADFGDIYLYEVTKQRLIMVTKGGGFNEEQDEPTGRQAYDFVWAPDDRRIVYKYRDRLPRTLSLVPVEPKWEWFEIEFPQSAHPR